MANLQIQQLSLAFADRDILKDISLNMSEGSRIALAGANGCGKSTLLKILAGLMQQDSGNIILQKGAEIGYLPQSGLTFKGNNLYQEAEAAFQQMHELVQRNEEIGDILKDKSIKDSEQSILLEELHQNQEALENKGYYLRESKIEQVLAGLGFSRDDFKKESSTFSGGWQMRIALAKVLLKNPDFLLLDEPTNYLDIEARQWLSPFLQNYYGGLLIVSHDKYFLDSLVNQVAEIFLGELKIFKGNYSRYQRIREEELERIQDLWKEQQKEIEKIEDFIRRFRYKESKAAQVQSRVKMLEKMDRIEIPDNLRKVSLQFPAPPHSGREVLRLRNLSKSYGEHQVLSNLDLDIEKGEKLVISGVNGSGKSTLMRILAGLDNDFTGELKWGSGVSVGYFAQDQDEHLNPDNTLLEELEEVASLEDIPKLRSMAGSFLFSGDDVYKRISFLSGGEKNRLALLKMLLRPFNLLIMDEPTNHLDIHSKEILLEALKEYPGTLIFVSHDQSFIEGLAGKVLELKENQYTLFYGNYEYYLWKRENPEDEIENSEVQTSREQDLSINQLNREEEKKRKAIVRRLNREEERLMDEIAKQEDQLEFLQNEIGKEENYSDPEKSKSLSEQIKEKESLTMDLHQQWEEVSEELQQYL